MRFLIDAQLPPDLGCFLGDRGHIAEHVRDIGLLTAGDEVLWDYAGKHGACIVTKDEDFADRVVFRPNGPAVVWVRLGNCSTRAMLAALEQLLPEIVARLNQGERLIEIV